MWQTLSWIGLVVGVALVFGIYVKVLNYLEDKADAALKKRVRRRYDNPWVHPSGVDGDEWQDVANERSRQHWESVARTGRKP